MKLSATDRMNLMKFVCSFVWTDLKVQREERDLVMRIAGRLSLSETEMRQVEKWLQVPPRADDIDPASVPRAHRELFLEAAEAVIAADDLIVPAEDDALALFRELLED